MKQLFKITLIPLFLSVFSFFAFGQGNAQIEKELITALKNIREYSAYGGNYDNEKLSKANDVFAGKLLEYTKNAATLQNKFIQLNKVMSNATSVDGKFRIYSWDTEMGGTMHDYSRVYQYLGADGKVYSKTDDNAEEDGGAGSFVYAIYTLEAKKGKIYIVCSNFIGSTQDHYQSANLYKIEGTSLKDKVKLIKTASGLTDTLNFEYNFFSVMKRKERPIKLILFDKNTKILKIPVVVNDQEFPNGEVTNKFIKYKFDGTYFIKVN